MTTLDECDSPAHSPSHRALHTPGSHAHTCPKCKTVITLQVTEVAAPPDLSKTLKLKLRWTFTIDTPSPSLNVLRRQYANARHYAALRNGFETYMMVARVNNKIPPATKIRRVHITRHAHSERSLLDIDNLIGGLKPVIDAMVRQKLIVDDNAEYLNAYYGQRVDGPARLVIVIEEM